MDRIIVFLIITVSVVACKASYTRNTMHPADQDRIILEAIYYKDNKKIEQMIKGYYERDPVRFGLKLIKNEYKLEIEGKERKYFIARDSLKILLDHVVNDLQDKTYYTSLKYNVDQWPFIGDYDLSTYIATNEIMISRIYARYKIFLVELEREKESVRIHNEAVKYCKDRGVRLHRTAFCYKNDVYDRYNEFSQATYETLLEKDEKNAAIAEEREVEERRKKLAASSNAWQNAATFMNNFSNALQNQVNRQSTNNINNNYQNNNRSPQSKYNPEKNYSNQSSNTSISTGNQYASNSQKKKCNDPNSCCNPLWVRPSASLWCSANTCKNAGASESSIISKNEAHGTCLQQCMYNDYNEFLKSKGCEYREKPTKSGPSRAIEVN